MANPFSKKRLEEGPGRLFTKLLTEGIHPNEAMPYIVSHMKKYYGEKKADPEGAESLLINYRKLHGTHAIMAAANEEIKKPLPPEDVIRKAKEQVRAMYKSLNK